MVGGVHWGRELCVPATLPQVSQLWRTLQGPNSVTMRHDRECETWWYSISYGYYENRVQKLYFLHNGTSAQNIENKKYEMNV